MSLTRNKLDILGDYLCTTDPVPKANGGVGGAAVAIEIISRGDAERVDDCAVVAADTHPNLTL